MKKLLMLVACCGILAGCGGGTRVIDTNDSRAVADMRDVMELEYRDWERTAEHMLDSMMKNRVFANTKNPVIAMGPMVNDTMKRFDTDMLVRRIRVYLVNNGHAQFATNFTGEDTTSNAVRAQRGNAEFDVSTIAGTGTLVAPNFSLSGKMLQRNIPVDTCWLCASKTRVEYYLQMVLTDVRTGLSVWEEERPIIKEGRRAPTW